MGGINFVRRVENCWKAHFYSGRSRVSLYDDKRTHSIPRRIYIDRYRVRVWNISEDEGISVGSRFKIWNKNSDTWPVSTKFIPLYLEAAQFRNQGVIFENEFIQHSPKQYDRYGSYVSIRKHYWKLVRLNTSQRTSFHTSACHQHSYPLNRLIWIEK